MSKIGKIEEIRLFSVKYFYINDIMHNNKIIIVLLLVNLAHAVSTVAVLEIISSGEAKLKISEYRHLTDELRTQAREVLPQNDYTVLTRDNILQLLPPDSEEAECLAESCAVDIGRAIGAEYVSQGFVGEFGKMLTLTVELYESMSGNLLGSFVTESNDIMNLLMTVREKAPNLYARILKGASGKSAPANTPSPQPVAPVSVPAVVGTNVVAKIVTEPAGAVLEVNGIPYQNCQKTPCNISLYENRFKLSAMLNEYKTVDTNLVITMPNQTVTIKLNPKTYSVNFASEPSGVSLNFNGQPNNGCRQTPCSMEFIKGNVKVSASLDLYESKDTTISVTGSNQRVNLKLKPKTYSVSFASEPSGVSLNFNGQPNNSCRQTPCSMEFIKGNVKVSASLDLYESKDTTISVTGNNQRVNLKLNPAFGVLEEQSYSYNNNLQNNLSPQVGTWLEKGISYGFWGGIALDVLGTAAIITAITKNQDMVNMHKKYRSLDNGASEPDFTKAWEKVDDAKTSRNVFYVLGGAFLAAGIGVHIWF